MSMPELSGITQEQAFTELLVSIALEENALAHFVNAEGEKIQAIEGMMGTEEGDMSPDEVIKFQKSVAKVMQTAIKMQMLLQFKLEDVLDAKKELELPST